LIRTIFIAAILLQFGYTKLFSQSLPYLLKEHPGIFKNVEKELINGQIETLYQECTKIISGTSDLKKKGIARFYIGQAADYENNSSLALSSFE